MKVDNVLDNWNHLAKFWNGLLLDRVPLLRHTHTHAKICCCSVTKSCPTLCDPITLGSSVFHYLSEFAQIHVH